MTDMVRLTIDDDCDCDDVGVGDVADDDEVKSFLGICKNYPDLITLSVRQSEGARNRSPREHVILGLETALGV